MFPGCLSTDNGDTLENVEEIPSMLNILTNKAQIAVEDGVFRQGGEPAVLEAIDSKNANVLNWFYDREYELKIGAVAETAVVMVCRKGGKPIFEDTYCRPGAPDRDHRQSSLNTCEITMSETDIAEICH